MSKIYSSTMDILRDEINNSDLKSTYNFSIDYYLDISTPIIEITSFETLSIDVIINLWTIINNWIQKYHINLINEFYNDADNNDNKYPIRIDIYRHNNLSEMPLHVKVLSSSIDLKSFL